MLQRGLFTVLLFTSFLFSHTQTIVPRFVRIGVNDGLSQSSVYSIYQDKFGFMWFGTADGLNRYDGNEIRIYKNKEKIENSGNSNLIRGKFCEDENFNIWFTTETGLYYFDRQQEVIKPYWIFPKQAAGILFYELVSLDKQQNLWLFNKSAGLVQINIKTGVRNHFQYPFKLPNLNMTYSDACVDSEGNIWFNVYSEEGFYRFNITTHQFNLFFKDKNYLNIFFGREKIYAISKTKIYRLDNFFVMKDSMDMGFAQNLNGNIHNIYEDEFDRLWVPSTSHGLFCYDFKQKKVFQYNHDNSKPTSISSNYATVVSCDRSQNLWIGTDGGGACKLDLKPSRFNLFPISESDHALKDYFVKCIFEDDKKRIWFGTNSNGLAIYDAEYRTIQNFIHEEQNASSLPGNNVGAIFKDRQNNMWIGCDLGIAIFNEQKKTFARINLKLPIHLLPNQPFVYRFVQQKNNDVLALTPHGLIRIRKNKQGKFSGVPEYSTAKSNFGIIDIAETSENDVWMASPLNGLFHCTFQYENDSFIVKEKFFSGIDVRSIHKDETDSEILWLASGKGLIRFDIRTKEFRLFNEEDGMANSYVYGILEDEKHNFWMSTNGGLIYFDRANNIFQNFKATDGLQSNEFNTGAFYKGASGNFYFGGIKGFNWFKNIDSASMKMAYKPSVAINDIFINDQRFQKDSSFIKNQSLRLHHYQNNISFSFAALDFTRPQANKIQYQLEGWDPHWFTSSSKTVRYSNLPSGQYVLKIKAINSNGIESDEEHITLLIETPFWKQWWFRVLSLIVLLAIAVIITKAMAQRKLRQQLRELEKQRAIEQERNRISRDMHDEIGSGLTQIALMSELMQTQKKADTELRKDVGNISLSARKLVESMSEIIWALNPQNDTLENLLAYLREQTISYFEPFNIDYTICFPDEVPFVKLSNEQRRNLFLVAKEALHNALKHSEATNIRFSMNYKKDWLCFQISDNGKGFDVSKNKIASNGLRNMRKRMLGIDGTFDIETASSGTCISFTLPVQKQKKRGTTFFTLKKER